jgi:hypothetical protein
MLIMLRQLARFRSSQGKCLSRMYATGANQSATLCKPARAFMGWVIATQLEGLLFLESQCKCLLLPTTRFCFT